MRFPGFGRKRETRAATIENPTVKVSAENFMEFFGLHGGGVPAVTIESALKVPALQAAVLFLSRTLATVPLQAFRRTENGPERIVGKLQTVLKRTRTTKWIRRSFGDTSGNRYSPAGAALPGLKNVEMALKLSGRWTRRAPAFVAQACGWSIPLMVETIRPAR